MLRHWSVAVVLCVVGGMMWTGVRGWVRHRNTNMLRHWCVAVVLGVVAGLTRTGVRGWERHPISCNFENGQCGWKNSENTTLHWTLHDVHFPRRDHYMALDMTSARVNDTGLLFSPMLNGSVNKTCRLNFTRHIKNDNRACQLSVFLVTETNWTLLWRTVDVTGAGWFGISWKSETSPDLQGPCTEPSFQIVFEGRKITSESCGGTVDVDDIVFEFSQPDISPPSPTPTTTSVPATELSTDNTHVDIDTQPSEHSTAPDHSQTNNHTEAYSANDSDSDASSAVIAAVVAIILAVVIIICLILIVFFLRRRAQKQGKTDHWTLHLFRTQKTPSPRPTRASAVYTNGCYVSCNDQVQANPGSNNSSGIHGGGHTGSVHHYNTVDDTGYELSSPFSPNTNEQGGGSCSNNQDSYNVLSLKDPQVHPPPGPLTEDFYNHLNEDGETPEPRSNPSASSRHHGQPGIQDDSKPSHLQDENSESPAKPIDHCSVSSKTGTTSNVAGAATTDCEMVGDDGAGNMMVSSLSASSASGADVYNRLGVTVENGDDLPQNHYDHFNDTDGEYSRTNAEEKTRDEQRELAADLYSHARKCALGQEIKK